MYRKVKLSVNLQTKNWTPPYKQGYQGDITAWQLISTGGRGETGAGAGAARVWRKLSFLYGFHPAPPPEPSNIRIMKQHSYLHLITLIRTCRPCNKQKLISWGYNVSTWARTVEQKDSCSAINGRVYDYNWLLLWGNSLHNSTSYLLHSIYRSGKEKCTLSHYEVLPQNTILKRNQNSKPVFLTYRQLRVCKVYSVKTLLQIQKVRCSQIISQNTFRTFLSLIIKTTIKT